MNRFRDLSVFLQYVLLFCLSLCCTVISQDTGLKAEGFLPVYSIPSQHSEVVEGSGDETVILQEKCDCSKITKTAKEIYHKNPEALVETSTPSSVIVIIVFLSLLLLACIAVIVYLVSKIKYLNMRQNVPVPDKTAEDYDSDEYSVMMDWNEPNIIVKQNKQKIEK